MIAVDSDIWLQTVRRQVEETQERPRTKEAEARAKARAAAEDLFSMPKVNDAKDCPSWTISGQDRSFAMPSRGRQRRKEEPFRHHGCFCIGRPTADVNLGGGLGVEERCELCMSWGAHGWIGQWLSL